MKLTNYVLKKLGLRRDKDLSPAVPKITVGSPSTKRFAGKSVLITGGTSGIGEGSVRAFAAEGAHVFFCGRRKEVGEKVEQEIRSLGGEATFFQADISIEAQVKAFCEGCVKKYGSIDIAFNNAGISSAPEALHLLSTETFDKIFATNVRGLYFCLKYQIPQMLKQENKGRIINNGSISAFKARDGQTPYSASKHAVSGLTKGAAFEYAKDGIIINSIDPYCVDTPMNRRRAEYLNIPVEDLAIRRPSKKMTTTHEVAELVMFLASSQNTTLLGLHLDLSLGATLY